MPSPRPELLAFMRAAEALITRSNNGELLSDVEADELSRCLGRLAEAFRLDGNSE